jgi:hypothetical protein
LANFNKSCICISQICIGETKKLKTLHNFFVRKWQFFSSIKKTLGWVGTNSLLFGIAEISEKYVLAMPKI